MSSNFDIRFLKPSDLNDVKNLCQEWFPIRYPDAWYEAISTNNHRFYSIVATIDNDIVGLLVAEIKTYLDCNYEDYGFLAKSFELEDTCVAYILTLGVISKLRRKGIATILVKSLIENLIKIPSLIQCKAIYLHVLTTNTFAIRFYEKLKFKRYKILPLYYSINDTACDGFSYVYYINGGRPPFSLWLWSLLSPKHFYFLFKNALINLCQSIYTHFNCDLKSFPQVAFKITPYRFVRKILQVVLPFIPQYKKSKSHLSVC